MFLKTINLILLLMVIGLLAKLLHGSGSIVEVKQLQATIKQQQDKMRIMHANNLALAHEIEYLKTEPLALEEQVRAELGMIRSGESYYQVVEPVE